MFKGCLPQILIGPFLNTLSHLSVRTNITGNLITRNYVLPLIFWLIMQHPYPLYHTFNQQLADIWVWRGFCYILIDKFML